MADRLSMCTKMYFVEQPFCILGSFIIGCTFGARNFVLLKQEQPIFTVIGVIDGILLLSFQGSDKV
jgi:hypothetical protein